MVNPGPDTSQIDLDELTKRRFPTGSVQPEPGEYRVTISQESYEEIIEHSQDDSESELCGVLVGNVYKDEHGAYLQITNTIKGEHAESGGSQVTFTHATWDHIHKVMDSEFQDKKIVGWYHTHPGFGVFLSEMDNFIHGNFFNGASQVAFVVDSVSEKEGFFAWREGKPTLCRRFWLDGEERVCVDPEDEGTPLSAQIALLGEKIDDLALSIKNLRRRAHEGGERGGLHSMVGWGLAVFFALLMLLQTFMIGSGRLGGRPGEIFVGSQLDPQTGAEMRMYVVPPPQRPDKTEAGQALKGRSEASKSKEKTSDDDVKGRRNAAE